MTVICWLLVLTAFVLAIIAWAIGQGGLLDEARADIDQLQRDNDNLRADLAQTNAPIAAQASRPTPRPRPLRTDTAEAHTLITPERVTGDPTRHGRHSAPSGA